MDHRGDIGMGGGGRLRLSAPSSHISGSMSQTIGVAPAAKIAWIVAAKVKSGSATFLP
ncbi:hypothetical protein [Pseudophaeobacter sp.]|uniref:hypothetical protein n=1 Tax=Pseudophaeobacter sp. TaxID=1971739 RepID=UPI00405A3372